jgi:hypothetical protein
MAANNGVAIVASVISAYLNGRRQLAINGVCGSAYLAYLWRQPAIVKARKYNGVVQPAFNGESNNLGNQWHRLAYSA